MPTRIQKVVLRKFDDAAYDLAETHQTNSRREILFLFEAYAALVVNPKISFVWDTEVAEVLGDEEVNGLRLRNLKTKEESQLPVQGLFLAIGHKPNTDLFKEVIDTDKAGYIVPSEFPTTNIPGVFAAGDVTDHRYRQAVTAAGDGCRAAIDVERWLEAQAEA